MQYSIENDILRLTVDSHGAEPVSVIHKPTGAELLWQADPAVWNRHAPILFPYTGKLTGGKMLAKGVEYAGGQHGFARDVEHTMTHHADNLLEFQPLRSVRGVSRHHGGERPPGRQPDEPGI